MQTVVRAGAGLCFRTHKLLANGGVQRRTLSIATATPGAANPDIQDLAKRAQIAVSESEVR